MKSVSYREQLKRDGVELSLGSGHHKHDSNYDHKERV